MKIIIVMIDRGKIPVENVNFSPLVLMNNFNGVSKLHLSCFTSVQ